MTSIITGDVINSKRTAPIIWLRPLKRELSRLGTSPKQWEIFRGDSFQAEVKDPALSLQTAVLIKSALKSIPGIDVRMAIGIGKKSYSAKHITESNGKAFNHSGTLAENLKVLKLNLAIQTDHPTFDNEMNVCLKLGLIAMNGWTAHSAATIHAVLLHPTWSQKRIGKLLGIKQNAVSTRLKRAHFEEIKDLIELYQQKIKALK